MKKVITTLQSASNAILSEIELQYPNGVEEKDFDLYRTTNGANFHALEITLGETTYLVKLKNIAFFNNYIEKDSTSEDSSQDYNTEELDLESSESEEDVNLDSNLNL